MVQMGTWTGVTQPGQWDQVQARVHSQVTTSQPRTPPHPTSLSLQSESSSGDGQAQVIRLQTCYGRAEVRDTGLEPAGQRQPLGAVERWRQTFPSGKR